MTPPSRRKRPNVVDSSGWLEYFANGPGAGNFEAPIIAVDQLVVPAVCLLEVFKVVLRGRGESDALQAVAVMRQGSVVDLDATLALAAAKVGIERRLPLADSIVYATAQMVDGVVWTQDDDFDGLPDVRFFRKSIG